MTLLHRGPRLAYTTAGRAFGSASGAETVPSSPNPSHNDRRAVASIDESVSVIMVSFHTGAALPRAIESVLGDPHVRQLILVNNGNPSKVREALFARAAEDRRIVTVDGQGNVGFSRGCNLGVASATGEYLLLLNPDCILPPGALKSLLEAGLGLADPWVLGPRLVFPDGREQAGARRREPSPMRILVEGLGLYRLFPHLQRINMHADPLPSGITPVDVISGACMLVPRKSFLDVGGMDEGYFLHVEDIDFCVRFSEAGGQAYFVPDVAVAHLKGSSSASLARVEWHKTKGFFRYLRQFRRRYRQPGLELVVRLALLLRFLVFLVRSAAPRRTGC